MSNQVNVHKIIACEKCKTHLWEFKILSYFTGGGKTKEDVTLGSTHWKGVHPLVESDRPPNDNWDCPICKRPYVLMDAASKRRQIMMIDVNTKRMSREWI